MKQLELPLAPFPVHVSVLNPPNVFPLPARVGSVTAADWSVCDSSTVYSPPGVVGDSQRSAIFVAATVKLACRVGRVQVRAVA